MKRADLTEKILDIKREKGWTWKHITDEIGGMSEVLVIGALLGQMKLVKPLATKAAALFGLNPNEEKMLNEVPSRGTVMPPSLESADRRGIRRRHHVRHRLRLQYGAPAQSQG
jgi:cyanate lyase